MMLQWSNADTEQRREDGVRLVCRYAEELGVPYQWSTIVNSMHTAIYDSGFLLAMDENQQVRGVMVCTFGTAPDKSADESRIQIHWLFLEKEYRNGSQLRRAMMALLEREKELPQPIVSLEFYSTPTERHRRLFGKFAEIRHTKRHPCGMLDLHLTTPERVKAYIERNFSYGRK